jgi:hypothetical protein
MHEEARTKSEARKKQGNSGEYIILAPLSTLLHLSQSNVPDPSNFPDLPIVKGNG